MCFCISIFSWSYWHILVKEIEKRGLPVAVAGIPKTIDNDIAVSFSVILYSAG